MHTLNIIMMSLYLRADASNRFVLVWIFQPVFLIMFWRHCLPVALLFSFSFWTKF